MIAAEFAQQIVESSTEFAIITLDPEGMITSWNIGAEALLGWPSTEAIGQPGAMIFTTEDQQAGSPIDEMRRSDLDGKAVDERFHVRKDGSRFWGSGLMSPLLGERGKAGYLKIARDRTAEREAERRFATLADAMPGFVFEADTDGHYVRINKLYRHYTGLEDAELLGDGWLQTIHPDQQARAEESWWAAIGTGELFEQSLLVRNTEEAFRYFSFRGVPERDDEERIIRWIGTCIDIDSDARSRASLEGLTVSLEHAVTDRSAQLEESYRALQEEVAEREKIEDALRQSQKMEAIGQLTGGVAHDFNNLLTVILGSVDLLRRPNMLSEEKRQRYLTAIAETAGRAANLTGQLLAFARRQPLSPQPFDVACRLRDAQDVLKTIAGSLVTIDLDVRCEPCVVQADPTQFDTAILNIVVNARDAMQAEGTLRIVVAECDGIPSLRGHCAVEGSFVSVALIDSGTGISSTNLVRIFEPFFTTKDIGKGTGLGLSQVFGFAKQSGGDIVIESEEGHGATFTLFLPKANDQSAHDEEPDTLDRSEPEPDALCVLLVEDNQLVGDFAAELLADLGYANQLVGTAQEALDLISAHPDRFHIVFTDVVMPGISGIELAHTLKGLYPDLPVILTSGYSHVLAAEGNHGFTLLQKPYTVERLSRALRNAL